MDRWNTTLRFEHKEIPLNSILIVRGYIHYQSGSEYHFSWGLDPRLHNIAVFCDDPICHSSDEYLFVIQRISAMTNSEIEPKTNEGTLVTPQDKKSLVSILDGIFNEFDVPAKNLTVVVDYKLISCF